MRVLLDGGPLRRGDDVLSLCLLPFAPLALYCALLCPLLLIAEQIRIALEHAGGFELGWNFCGSKGSSVLTIRLHYWNPALLTRRYQFGNDFSKSEISFNAFSTFHIRIPSEPEVM